MSKRVLQPKEAEKARSFTLKLPAALYQDLQAFKAELAKVAPGLMFNASAICAEALADALKRARRELEDLKAEKAGEGQARTAAAEAPAPVAREPERTGATAEASGAGADPSQERPGVGRLFGRS